MERERDMHPAEIARIEQALLELFAAYGHSLNSIQSSIQANINDGVMPTEIVLPGMSVMGLKLNIDHTRPMGKGMFIRCKKNDEKRRPPEANA